LIGPLSFSEYQVSPKQSQALQNEFLLGTPLAYLQGYAEFYDHKFFVNSSVLIPRPETELLVDELIQQKYTFERMADVGVGSGAILLSLISRGIVKTGVGIDLSATALEVARVNARRLRIQNQCEFILSDRFKEVNDEFDLIVSNPPYIKESSHRSLVQPGVDQFEPHMALYLSDEEYDQWFIEFFSQIKLKLRPTGLFLMEGHELELEQQAKLLVGMGFHNVRMLKDLRGLPRFLKAYN
jgi:release factor glutamine methyltransferase